MTTSTVSATIFGVLVAVSPFISANAQAIRTQDPTRQAARSFALTDGNDLMITGGKAETVEYQGRKAVRLTTQSKEDVFAFLKEIQFQDGTIEADIAMKVTTPPGYGCPASLASHSAPGRMARTTICFTFGRAIPMPKTRRCGTTPCNTSLRRGSTGTSYAENGRGFTNPMRIFSLMAGTRSKIEVHGRTAKLYVNGSENPSLIVNGLKGEDLQGSVALWGYPGEEAYFSNVKVIPARAEAVTDGGEASGTWEVKFSSDYGSYSGSMNLRRDGEAVTGTWSGAFGQDQPVSGTWRNGYVELTFNGTWPSEKPAPVTLSLAGWIDGDSAKGRMKAEGRADGQWTAVRKK